MSMLEDFQRLMGMEDEEPQFHRASESPRLQLPGTVEDCNAFTALVRASNAILAERLIALIYSHPPEFFERLALHVLERMLGGRQRQDLTRRLGQTGDGGVDGIIALDALGLDQVYFQAKRLRPGTLVPIADIRDFAGALEAKHASKGVFVATTGFSSGALEFCSRISRRVVLIDGNRLAELMISHNIGVKVKESFEIKRIDIDYFKGAGAARRQGASIPSAGTSLSY